MSTKKLGRWMIVGALAVGLLFASIALTIVYKQQTHFSKKSIDIECPEEFKGYKEIFFEGQRSSVCAYESTSSGPEVLVSKNIDRLDWFFPDRRNMNEKEIQCGFDFEISSGFCAAKLEDGTLVMYANTGTMSVVEDIFEDFLKEI